MSAEPPWKQRLYQSYVSSGQVPTADTSADSFFRSRAPYLRNVIDRHVPADRALRVVDLGCGHGACLYFLKRAGYRNVIGVDVSHEQIEQAHQLGISEAEPGQLGLFLDNSSSASVDVIILFDVLEHLSRDDMFKTLDGVYRVLKPGGSCIVHVPNAEGIYGMRVRYGDLTHENAFTQQSLNQLFTAIGFRGFECFEDRPRIHGMRSFIRRALWEAGTFPCRVLFIAETGRASVILSQNILAVITK